LPEKTPEKRDLRKKAHPCYLGAIFLKSKHVGRHFLLIFSGSLLRFSGILWKISEILPRFHGFCPNF